VPSSPIIHTALIAANEIGARLQFTFTDQAQLP
jgi:hypothetical protein